MKINITSTIKKLYLGIVYDHGYVFNHKILETEEEAGEWCSHYGGCDCTVIPFELETPHFGIHEEVKWTFPTLPRFDCGMKVGCLTDILANPTIILYQRETSIYCPIFL